MQGLTTQKHDFVQKFQYRQSKIAPRNNIERLRGCVEDSTIQGLSFMPPNMCNYSKAESFKPIIRYKPPESKLKNNIWPFWQNFFVFPVPMEFETTQKLSFMPVCPSPKDDMPWARKAKYCPPSIRFAQDTIKQLSYQAPGCFLDDNAFCCDLECDNMPRASCWSATVFRIWNLNKNIFKQRWWILCVEILNFISLSF